MEKKRRFFQGGHGFCPACRTRRRSERASAEQRSTAEKFRLIRENGYELHVEWSCSFEKRLRENEELRRFAEEEKRKFIPRLDWTGRSSEEEFLEKVVGLKDDEIASIIWADVYLPPEFRDAAAAEFPFAVAKHSVRLEDQSAYTRELVRILDKSKSWPKQLLLNGYAAEDVLLIGPMTKFLLANNYRIRNVRGGLFYVAKAIYRPFVRKETERRKLADARDDPVSAQIAKLTVNSAYG